MSDITDVQNSLYINFTGIHAFEYLFSVKIYEKRDQDEISRLYRYFHLIRLDDQDESSICKRALNL